MKTITIEMTLEQAEMVQYALWQEVDYMEEWNDDDTEDYTNTKDMAWKVTEAVNEAKVN